jgi:ABC-type transport system substrate-binding protein
MMIESTAKYENISFVAPAGSPLPSQLMPSARGSSRLTRRGFLAATAALAPVALLPRKAFANSESPPLRGRDPGSLVVLVDAAVEDLDPATNTTWAFGLEMVYETLVRLDGTSTNTVAPALAQSFIPNSDRTQWWARLRPRALFSDGTVCDAAAVRAAILRTIALPSGQGYVWEMTDPERQVSVEDTQTVRFAFPQPRPYFDLEVAGQFGFWVAGAAAAAHHSLGPADLGHQLLGRHPLGTGPFILESNDPGQEAVFRRNPHYPGAPQRGQFSRVIIKTIPVKGTRRQLLESGAADIIWSGTPEDTVALSADPRFSVTNSASATVRYIVLGCYGHLADARARLAINRAFDRRKHLRQVLLNTQDAAHGVFPSCLATADRTIDGPEFDLREARALLDAAGVPRGAELTYVYYQGNGGTEGQILQAWLAQIDIRLKLIEKSYSAFIDDYMGDAPPEHRASMYHFSWWPNHNHPHAFANVLFHSGSVGSAGANAGYYRNSEADRLIERMRGAPIGPPLQMTSSRLQRLLASEDPPWVPLFQERAQFTCRTDISGLVLNPIYASTFDCSVLRRATRTSAVAGNR